MRLRDHPNMDRWPPDVGGASSKSCRAPDDGLDVLERVFYLRATGPTLPRVGLATVSNGARHMRDLFVRDNLFVIFLCEFLQNQKGKTIRAIGELEMDF